MAHKLRGVRVEQCAYYVNKLRENVGVETGKWRQIVTSHTAHTKYKWHRMVRNENRRHENVLRTPLHTHPTGRGKSPKLARYFYTFMTISYLLTTCLRARQIYRIHTLWTELLFVISWTPQLIPTWQKSAAAKLKLTDFRVNFLLCLLFGPAGSTNWWCFNWITQWCIF